MEQNFDLAALHCRVTQAHAWHGGELGLPPPVVHPGVLQVIPRQFVRQMQ